MTELTIPRYAPIWRTILEFNGKSDYVEIPNKPDINFGKQDFTVACWVRAAKEQQDRSNGDNDIVSKFSGATQGFPYAIRYFNKKGDNNKKGDDRAGKIIALRSDRAATPQVISEAKVDDGQFHHIAFVRKTEGESAKLYLYVDGKSSGTADDTTNPEQTTNDSPLYLGMRGDPTNCGDAPSYFTGSIGRLLIFNKALDEKQLRYLMRQNTPILPQDNLEGLKDEIGLSLVGDWRCNEGYGAIAFDYANSNNGVLGGKEGLEARPEWVASTIPMFIEFIKNNQKSGTQESSTEQTPESLEKFLPRRV